MKIFSIAGWSGSGKTLLITRLIEYFKGKKQRVIAVKKTHREYALQPEAKDTAKFLQAGADEVYLLSKGELLRMTALANEQVFLAGLKKILRENDIVLMEGLFQEGIPVIEVAGGRQPLKFPPAKLAAVISDQPGPAGPPSFHPDHIPSIADFMEEYHGQQH
jgi:molybdopterin-guanine dinucleotide biosynthesis protein B